MKIFDRIQLTRPKRSVFDLSHERKFSMNMGDLVPILCQEVVPGDSFRLSLQQLVRMQPMLAPMMHRVNVTTHFFFVPNRLIWNEWEDFITGGDKGDKNPVFPTFNRTSPTTAAILGLTYGSLSDYLGYPVSRIAQTGNVTIPKFSQLPYRAYHLIWNEYYRDQNLQKPVDINLSSGNTILTQINSDTNAWAARAMCIQKRAWEKDYFTSALPYAQKGEQLSLPFSSDAPVVSGDNKPVHISASSPNNPNDHYIQTMGEQGQILKADLSNTSTAKINELRQAFQIQKWLEKNARGGSRYIEQILTHFGVKSSDARLQRPEYLGGGKTPVTISEVLQNSATEESSPQGNMTGHGVSVGSTHSFKRTFEEHGFIIGIMSVLPRTAYFQGMPKIFNKFDRFDYYWPEFAHLGEQEVKMSELYYDPSGATNDETFGYQPRYSEYRFINDSVHGDFQNTLKFWHMAREFNTKPALNSSFVKANPTNRVFAVTDPKYPKLLVNTYANIQAVRPMPKYGNPGGI
jgi:hypothetical protein